VQDLLSQTSCATICAPKGKKQLFGQTKSVPGEAHTARDDLLAKQNNNGSSTGKPVSLFFGVHLTDVHIIDEESDRPRL
jgi:hypothetical protein